MRTLTLPTLLACLALSRGARAANADDRLWTAGSDAAKVCAPCLDDYLIVPEYRANCGSSRGVTLEALRKQLATEYTWPGKGKEERHTAPADEAEVRAADALRTVEPGDYGWLHSVEVVKVDGERDMLVKNLRLADAKTAKADLKKFSDNVTANWKKEQAAAKDVYGRQIDALEKQKKNLEAWRAFGKEQDKTNQAGGGQNDAAKVKIDELQAQIKKLEQQKSDALKQLASDKSALLKAAKQRDEARLDADRLQKKLRKEFSQTFRLTGFATAHVRAGDRFAGPKEDGLQVAVAWRDPAGTPVLADVELLQKPLDKPGLGALLAKRKTTPAEFAVQMTAARRGKTGEEAKQAAARAMAQWIRNK